MLSLNAGYIGQETMLHCNDTHLIKASLTSLMNSWFRQEDTHNIEWFNRAPIRGDIWGHVTKAAHAVDMAWIFPFEHLKCESGLFVTNNFIVLNNTNWTNCLNVRENIFFRCVRHKQIYMYVQIDIKVLLPGWCDWQAVTAFNDLLCHQWHNLKVTAGHNSLPLSS